MKRKLNPRLPNGFGSIRYLGKGRKNSYAVLAPAKSTYDNGEALYDKPIAYVDSWSKGFSVLVMYHEGTYRRGEEIPEVIPTTLNKATTQEIVDKIWRTLSPSRLSGDGLTFEEVYDRFYDDKFNQTKKIYSDSSKRVVSSAFGNCTCLHERCFKDLKYQDLQDVVDNLSLKHASKELVVMLFHQMYKYALIHEIVNKDVSAHISIKDADDDEHGVPFYENEIEILWENKSNPIARFLLIMIYSGFRINEYKGLEINLGEGYFKGGSKTKAGKDRIVPIHSGIVDLIRESEQIPPYTYSVFTKKLSGFLADTGLPKHTAHDCRHTFAMLCDKYGVTEVEKKRMLGHTFTDITNKVYGHSDLEKQKSEIEKIQIRF